jgi:proline iminopeptidase
VRQLYPAIEPYRHGLLEIDDQQLYWEACGNPDGKPVVFLHGGPGGACTPAHRRLFDPAAYRIVLLDQRGCGLSRPHVARLSPDPGSPGRPAAAMAQNTTAHLVADLEALREYLGITTWQVFGGSWGSTLALAYAEQHGARVTELVLRGIFTGRRGEIDWLYGGGAATFFPELWVDFLAPVPAEHRDGDLIAAYTRLLWSDDAAVAKRAAAVWSGWEGALSTLRPRPELVAQFGRPDYALALARIENHYVANGCFLTEGQLLAAAGRLAGISGVIVHGRYDVLCPPVNAWELHRVWPDSELVMVPDAGHAFDEPGILDALVEATDRFR